MLPPDLSSRVYAVLMAGGAGTRFWPLSRRRRPKQVLSVTGDRSMIRAAWDRIVPLVGPERILVVTGVDQVGAIRLELPDVLEENLVLEPVARNTAPCLGLAAVVAEGRCPGAVLICLSADHWIGDEDVFRKSAEVALARADAGRTLITFGIRPSRPATGYGYILQGEETGPAVRKVERFVEKPDLEKAKEYLASGRYLWNSGMFAWRADVFLDEVKRHLPELSAGLEELSASPSRRQEVFPRLPTVSVDYGVLEKTDRAEVVASEFPWSDLGSFVAFEPLLERDDAGNRARGALIALDTKDTLVFAPDGHVVATLGVEDLVIVVTDDATLVCRRDRVEEVKRVVAELKSSGGERYT